MAKNSPVDFDEYEFYGDNGDNEENDDLESHNRNMHRNRNRKTRDRRRKNHQKIIDLRLEEKEIYISTLDPHTCEGQAFAILDEIEKDIQMEKKIRNEFTMIEKSEINKNDNEKSLSENYNLLSIFSFFYKKIIV